MSIDNNIDFKDHIVQYPNRFKQTTVAPGIVELVPTWIETPEQIIQPGTPVDAELFKKLKENVTCYSQTYTATEGQTVFSVEHPYNVGQSRISVYVGGVKQRTILDFTEASSTSFILKEGLKLGTKVEAVTISYVQPLASDVQQQVNNLLESYTLNQLEINLARTEPIKLSRIADYSLPASKLKVSADSDRIKLSNLSDEVLQAMAGNTPINTTPGISSVTTEKIAAEAVEMTKIAKTSELLALYGQISGKRMIGYWNGQIQYTDDTTSFVSKTVILPDYGKLQMYIKSGVGSDNQALILLDDAGTAIQNFDFPFIYNVAGNAQYKDIISYNAIGNYYTIDVDKLRVFKPNVRKGVFGFKTGDPAYIKATNARKLDWLNIEDNMSIIALANSVDALETDVALIAVDQVEIILQNEYSAVVDKEFNLYTDNVVLCNNPEDYLVDYVCTSPRAKQLKECFRLTPSGADVGNLALTINVYKKNLLLDKTLVASKNITIKVVADAPLTAPVTAVFIGDSLTNNDVYQREIKNMAGSNFTLLGTRGTAPYLHEGRPSWQANHYTQNASYNGMTNAFWNPSTSKFDFAYYMQQQGYTSVDYVSIFLGTNNFYATGAIPFIVEMVNSIKAYNSNIKVMVFTAHLPAANNDGFGNMGGAGQTAWEFAWQSIRFTQAIYDTFGNREAEKIYVIPIHINQDRVHDYYTETVNVSARTPISVKRYTDNVHPSSYGILKFADVWYAKFKSL